MKTSNGGRPTLADFKSSCLAFVSVVYFIFIWHKHCHVNILSTFNIYSEVNSIRTFISEQFLRTYPDKSHMRQNLHCIFLKFRHKSKPPLIGTKSSLARQRRRRRLLHGGARTVSGSGGVHHHHHHGVLEKRRIPGSDREMLCEGNSGVSGSRFIPAVDIC